MRAAGELQHKAKYELIPGQLGSGLTVLTDGKYVVTATVKNDCQFRGVVRVSECPDESIGIEIDDGGVSIAVNDG